MSRGYVLYCAIKVDIVKSSEIVDHMISDLIYDCIKHLKNKFPNEIVSSDIGLGDEFEILLQVIEKSYDLLDEIYYFFKQIDIEIYCGMGLGGISTEVFEQSRVMVGEAFIFADIALKNAKNVKDKRKRIMFSGIEKYRPLVEKLNLKLEQLFSMKLNLTNRQEHILHMRKRMNGKQIAHELNISESAVSQSLKGSDYKLIFDLEDEIKDLLQNIDMNIEFSNGCGLYFFPPINYEYPIDTFSFGKYKISITNNGYLAVNTKDKEISIDIINSIFLSFSLLKKKGVHKASNSELESWGPLRSGTYLTPRTYLSDPKIGQPLRDIFNTISKDVPIKKTEFSIILKFAKKIFKSRYKVGLFTFYDCYTRLQIEDYLGSVLMSWITVEYYLSLMIEQYSKKMDKKKKWVDEFNPEWNTLKKVEFIREQEGGMNFISKVEYENYKKIGSTRDRIIHNTVNPTDEEARECELVADSIMMKILKIENIDLKRFENELDMIE